MDGLTIKDKQLICHVLANYPTIKQAILYGSRAMGRHREGSDIDLTLIFNEQDSLDLILLNQISAELDDLLLPYSIDLSSFHDIENEELQDHIERIGVVFYQRGTIDK